MTLIKWTLVSVRLFQIGSRWMDFHETWYESYDIADHANAVLFDYLQSITTRWTANTWDGSYTSATYYELLKVCMFIDHWNRNSFCCDSIISDYETAIHVRVTSGFQLDSDSSWTVELRPETYIEIDHKQTNKQTHKVCTRSTYCLWVNSY